MNNNAYLDDLDNISPIYKQKDNHIGMRLTNSLMFNTKYVYIVYHNLRVMIVW